MAKSRTLVRKRPSKLTSAQDAEYQRIIKALQRAREPASRAAVAEVIAAHLNVISEADVVKFLEALDDATLTETCEALLIAIDTLHARRDLVRAAYGRLEKAEDTKQASIRGIGSG